MAAHMLLVPVHITRIHSAQQSARIYMHVVSLSNSNSSEQHNTTALLTVRMYYATSSSSSSSNAAVDWYSLSQNATTVSKPAQLKTTINMALEHNTQLCTLQYTNRPFTDGTTLRTGTPHYTATASTD
jgi:hypothetical protein